MTSSVTSHVSVGGAEQVFLRLNKDNGINPGNG